MDVINSRVVNIDELTLEHFEKGDKFKSDCARIGPLLGAKDPGYSYDVFPPGKCSCPFHSHRDSKKIGAYGGELRHMTHTAHDLDYWTDEI